MAILRFTLSPEALAKLHDALVCLGKFSETVSIEAVQDKLILTALNSSKSAYASFTLLAGRFISNYQFKPVRSGGTGKDNFACKIYSKALLAVFKGRAVDPSREKETAIERCDVAVEDDEGETESRFVVKIFCRHGVLKTYRLTFESAPPMHALFVKETAKNTWSITSRTLRELVEHFGPGTDQLDIYSEDGRVSLTSYTEKIMSGNAILKQPLHTTIAIDASEFSTFSVEEKLHIVISVKDFKSIITHAGTSNFIVKALYSRPSSPMQIIYREDGIISEFILMTMGEARGVSSTPAPYARGQNPNMAGIRQVSRAGSNSTSRAASQMPPPPMAAARSVVRENTRNSRPSPPPPQPSIQSRELFYPEDDDRRWDPVNYDEEDDGVLGWDTSAKDNDAPLPNSGRRFQVDEVIPPGMSAEALRNADSRLPPTQRLEPTQRLSGIRGIFDD